jgi:glucose/arabinose dehydrogenase
MAVLIGLAALACSLPGDLIGPPLPTVDVTALFLLTSPPGTEATQAGAAASQPSPTNTTPEPTASPSATTTTTATATASPTATATVTATASASPTPLPSATKPPPALPATQPPAAPTSPPAPPAALTPPVNRFNDMTGPVDVSHPYSLTYIAGGIPFPVAMADPHDGSGRLFIAGQEGRIYILQNGQVLPQPFLDIDPLVIERREEQGFLGLAFHPNFAQNGYFYVHYMAPDIFNIVERYSVAAGNPNQADPASNMLMLRVQGIDGMHNGGQLAFGPYDGDLYVGLGDGGGANDPNGWAQSRTVLRGKILRLDVDGGTPYAIPPENPYNGADGSRREIWAFGLRNPWRFSFDRARGDLWIADVGQENTEEINFQEVFHGAGVNYGWDLMEGLSCNLGFPCEGRGDLTTPLQYYFHENGRCAIIGGYVYRGASLPGLTGAYLYGDFCTGEIWAMRFNAAGDRFFNTLLMDTDLPISSFGEDAAGEIYVLGLNGTIWRIAQN